MAENSTTRRVRQARAAGLPLTVSFLQWYTGASRRQVRKSLVTIGLA